jgi:nucleoside-diphosphate kinase
VSDLPEVLAAVPAKLANVAGQPTITITITEGAPVSTNPPPIDPNAAIEGAGLRIVAQRRVKLTTDQAKKFYEVHAERPFYGELVEQMTAEPVVVQVLEGENAVAKYREVMGATNPEQAAEGTIRKQFALSIGENSVHGSDSLDNAKIEIEQFFTEDQIVG